MHETRSWKHRGLDCFAYYEDSDRYILCVYTPHQYPCSIRANCVDVDHAVELTNIFADSIADILDPVNY